MRAGHGRGRRIRAGIAALRWMALLGCALTAVPAAAGVLAVPEPGDAAGSCEAAITRAELHHGLPAGMLRAIGVTESGRPDPATRSTRPWPWAVQASNQGRYFATKSEAVAWVRETLAKGQKSIDTGCLQINLLHHPSAFPTLDAAFDPDSNADYAARFLLKLHGETQDWPQAIAFYHSRTPVLGMAYQRRVQGSLGGVAPAGPRQAARRAPDQTAASLVSAWQATMRINVLQPRPGPGRDWNTLLRPGS